MSERRLCKISIITVCYDAEATIIDTIQSVVSQQYPNVEYIVVDGGSTDRTVEVIKQHEQNIDVWVSEEDQGIYDAMNKGIGMATGDIIGFLNADDMYANDSVLSTIARTLKDSSVDICFADIQFINNQDKIVRYYSSARFSSRQLSNGWMPAHPSLYVRKEFFDRVGLFRTDYQIAADYEWVVRAFSTHEATWKYVSEVWVYMRMGGASTKGLKSRWILNHEIVRACRENNIDTNIFKVLSKFPLKLLELLKGRI